MCDGWQGNYDVVMDDRTDIGMYVEQSMVEMDKRDRKKAVARRRIQGTLDNFIVNAKPFEVGGVKSKEIGWKRETVERKTTRKKTKSKTKNLNLNLN